MIKWLVQYLAGIILNCTKYQSPIIRQVRLWTCYCLRQPSWSQSNCHLRHGHIIRYMKTGANIFGFYLQHCTTCLPILILYFFISSCDKNYPTLTARNAANFNVQYVAIFVPANPHDSTNAYGVVNATYNSFSHMLDYSIHWNSLTSLPIAIHINDKDSIMINLPVFPRVLSDSISGTAFISSGQADDMSAGYVYVMIHTIKYPYGEVIATMNKQWIWNLCGLFCSSVPAETNLFRTEPERFLRGGEY